MVDRSQVTREQPVRKLVGIQLVGLVAAVLATPIADNDPIDDRREQIVKPLGLGAFLERDVNGAAHAAEELNQRPSLRGQNAADDHAPALLADRRHGRCLMYIERHILGRPLHEGRSLV
jgi:hypothetical protein